MAIEQLMEIIVKAYADMDMDMKEYVFVQIIFIFVKKNVNLRIIKLLDVRNFVQNFMDMKIIMNVVVNIYAINIVFIIYYLRTIQKCVKDVINTVI